MRRPHHKTTKVSLLMVAWLLAPVLGLTAIAVKMWAHGPTRNTAALVEQGPQSSRFD